MHHRTTQRAVAIAAGILAAMAAGRAHAQASERIGGFSVEIKTDSTGQDRSFAALEPSGGLFSAGAETGVLFLACGRDSAGLSGAVILPAYGGAGDTLHVSVGLGQDAPETFILEGTGNGTVSWFLRNEDVAPFVRRALQADSLVIQSPDASEPARFAYGLVGLDAVLRRLGCAAAPPDPARLAGRSTLESFAPEGVPLGSITPPRLTNAADLMRYLQRNYPPAMREAGVGGEVNLRFRVMEDGRVDSASVQVLQTAHEGLNDAAMGAVRILRFRPAQAFGRRVKAWIELPLVFTVTR